MTILFFARLFFPHGGGVERHVLEIGKRLVKKGHKVTVVTEEISQTYNINNHSFAASANMAGKEKEIVEGIEVYRIPVGGENWFKKFRIWGWLLTHKNLIEQADVVHAHDVFFWYFPFRFLYFLKPAYVTFHGYETVYPPTKKAIFVRKLSEKLALGNICVGDFIAKWYGTKINYVTYGAIEVSSIKYQVSRVKSKKIKIILIGRLEEDIGVRIYMDALELLKKRGVEYQFEAYGEGSLKSDLEKYGKVHEHSSAVVEKAIEHADIVFASSYLTILSVLAAKRLVFSVFNNSLKKDYLVMTPFAKWISISGSGENLADAITFLAGSEGGKDMVENAYAWVKLQSWDKVTELYLKLWKEK